MTGDRVSKYKYNPLQSASHFRILSLSPGQPSSAIRCRLQEVTSSNNISYHALSYVWGPPSFTHRILCDKGYLWITGSLVEALQHYRSRTAHLSMWIDAICINQADILERSQQVLLMQQIYRQSAKVYIWLGKDNAATREAFNFMPEILSLYNAERDSMQFDGAMMQMLDEEILSNLNVLFANPWFRRCWTYQEIISCNDAEFACGSHQVSLKLMYKFCYWLWKLGIRDHLPSRDARLSVGQFNNTDLFRRLCSERSSDARILKLAQFTRARLSSDPRDKIYSLASIASDPEPLPYPPSYEISTSQLYRDFAAHTITTNNSLEILEDCIYGVSDLNLPSWAPDWTKLEPLTVSFNDEMEPYESSKRLRKMDAYHFDGDALHVHGILIDTLKIVSAISLINGVPQMPGASTLAITLAAAGKRAEVLRDARKIALQSGISEPDLDHTEAWWKTITGGRDKAGARLTRDYASQVSFYIKSFEALVDGRSEAVHRVQSAAVEASTGNTGDVETQFSVLAAERRFCSTSDGRLGWVPKAAKKGDVIGILTGAPLPIVLRPKGMAFEVVGACYVHGVMDGETVEDEGRKLRQIDLL